MSGATDKPHAEAVWAQVDRLCEYERFRKGPKLKRLLRFVVAQWLLGSDRAISERFIGDALAGEPDAEQLTFDRDTGTAGYPSTKGSLGHVRRRLAIYYLEPAHSLDPVIIKMHKGSYMPVIAFNPAAMASPPLDEANRRLILRTKTALDARTYSGASRAYGYFSKFLESDSKHFLKFANLAFIPFAIAPVASAMARFGMTTAERSIERTRSLGFNPWECVFAEGCIKAARDHEWAAALHSFDEAKDSSQQESLYYWWHTALLASTGKIGKAITILETAVQHFCRTNLATRTDLAMLQVMAGRYGDAEETLSSTLDFVSPANPLIAYSFAILYEAQDRIPEAVAASRAWFERWRTVPESAGFASPEYEQADWHGLLSGMLGLICGRGRDETKAKEIADILVSRKTRRQSQSSFEVALAMIGIQEFEQATDWLRTAAFEEHDPLAMWFNTFPPLRHLRGHESFHKLLDDLHLG